MILRSLVLAHFYQRVTDRQTDTPPIAKSRYSIAERDNKCYSVIVRTVAVTVE